jgi:hypothetical protein
MRICNGYEWKKHKKIIKHQKKIKKKKKFIERPQIAALLLNQV